MQKNLVNMRSWVETTPATQCSPIKIVDFQWQTDLCHDDVQEGSDHNDEVEVVPGVFDVLSKAESSKLDDKLEGKEGGEHEVHEVEELGVRLGLEGNGKSSST